MAIVCGVFQGIVLGPLFFLIYRRYINPPLNYVFIYLLMTPAYFTKANPTKNWKLILIFLLITLQTG